MCFGWLVLMALTPAFFMVWWLYLDWKEVLYNGCYIHHYSWEFCGTTTGLLLPETSLCSYLGGKWDQTMLTPPALQVTLKTFHPLQLFQMFVGYFPSLFLSLFQVCSRKLTAVSSISCHINKFWYLLIMLTSEHPAVCKFDLQLRFCSSKDVKCEGCEAGT